MAVEEEHATGKKDRQGGDIESGFFHGTDGELPDPFSGFTADALIDFIAVAQCLVQSGGKD